MDAGLSGVVLFSNVGRLGDEIEVNWELILIFEGQDFGLIF